MLKILRGKAEMKKNLFLVVSLLVLLALGTFGSYLYFSNFSKRIPSSQTHLPGKFSR
jgi:uncharacterized protein (UPF0333 family)